MLVEEIEKLEKDFLQLSPTERAAIGKAIIEGAVKHVRRRKKADNCRRQESAKVALN